MNAAKPLDNYVVLYLKVLFECWNVCRIYRWSPTFMSRHHFSCLWYKTTIFSNSRIFYV